MLTLVRKLRHGPLKFLSPLWVCLGDAFRSVVARSGMTVQQKIGAYGPFKLDAKFAFSNFENWGGAHNDGFGDCVEACRNAQCVLDVGGHIGLVSLPIASILGDDAKLVAFEPATANHALLKRHIELNGFSKIATVENSLVGETDEAEIPFFEMDDASGMNSVAPGAMGEEYKKNTKPQVALDSYCQKHDLKPDVIKIDVEGAELGVLRGAQNILQTCRPKIFLSVHPRQIALMGETVEALSELIETAGYDCSHADGSPVETFGLREYVLTPRDTKRDTKTCP